MSTLKHFQINLNIERQDGNMTIVKCSGKTGNPNSWNTIVQITNTLFLGNKVLRSFLLSGGLRLSSGYKNITDKQSTSRKRLI